jgi:predicted ATPase
MVRSFRGKEVNMLALAKKNEHKIALGNASMNSKGDIIGKGGIIIKTREEQLREYEESVLQQTESGFKTNNLSDLEKTLQKITNKPEKIKPIKKDTEEKKEVKQQEIIYDEE